VSWGKKKREPQHIVAIVTEECIEDLRRKGSETIYMVNGDSVRLIYDKSLGSGPKPGLRGDGFYIAESETQ